jgi:hypothetical protein
MRPGHEAPEYGFSQRPDERPAVASMRPGHEAPEY